MVLFLVTKKRVLLKWYSDFSRCCKGIKNDPDMVFDDQYLDKITKLKTDFDQLSPESQISGSALDSTQLNCDISYDEVSSAINKSQLVEVKQDLSKYHLAPKVHTF